MFDKRRHSPVLAGLALGVVIAAAPTVGALAAALDEVRVNATVADGYNGCPHCATGRVPVAGALGVALDEVGVNADDIGGEPGRRVFVKVVGRIGHSLGE